MIPKVIHYCWFGKKSKSESIYKCIDSWKKHCLDYEIKEWNEDNFDININKYVREAYEKKKWAFVSDYVRLYVLYKEGGVYLDTDIEITQNINEFLIHEAFIGQEDNFNLSTALIGAEKGNAWVGHLLADYNNRGFVLEDRKLDLTTNVERITNLTKNMFTVEFKNEHIVVGENIHIYPKEYFSKLDIKRKNENYSIHHFNGSWLDSSMIKKDMIVYKNSYMTLNYIVKDMFNNNCMLIKFLKDRTFSVYGFGTIGQMFLKQCNEIGRTPEYIIDQNAASFVDYTILKETTDIVKSDILIVTPIMYFNEIYEQINKNNFKKIVVINEVYDKEILLY